jgi:hypothetical protein
MGVAEGKVIGERGEGKAVEESRLLIGRSDRIRTYDPLVPNQMRYQTALRSDWP